MDDRRFDHWIRILTSPNSRRTITRMLTASAFGTFLSQRQGTVEAAKCIKPGRKCDKRNQKRDRCCGGAKCKRKRCRCPKRRAQCGRTCCARGQICAGGQCVTGQDTCPAGVDSCGETTVFCGGEPNCVCMQRLAGGTRCVENSIATACNQCTTDAECVALGFPPGTSCVRDEGPVCFCPPGPGGMCGAPCGLGIN